jgi:hypothetical protein
MCNAGDIINPSFLLVFTAIPPQTPARSDPARPARANHSAARADPDADADPDPASPKRVASGEGSFNKGFTGATDEGFHSSKNPNKSTDMCFKPVSLATFQVGVFIHGNKTIVLMQCAVSWPGLLGHQGISL